MMADPHNGSVSGCAYVLVGWVALHGLMAPSQRLMSWRFDCFMSETSRLKAPPKQSETLVSWSLQPIHPVGIRLCSGGAQGTTVLSYSQPILPTCKLTLSSEHISLAQAGQPHLRKTLQHLMRHSSKVG